MVSRFQGSGTEKQGGQLAVYKQDFNAHVTGGDWRHGADQIDMNPVISALGGLTVQQTLQQLAAFLAAQGTGFISIGIQDGYDGYATGVYNVNSPSTPTLEDAFTAAFADARLENGGVILLLAGTYYLSSTVEVPPGITIMGELAGSVIVNRGIEQSMFKILAGTENTRIGGDSGSGTIRLQAGDPLDATTFFNLILADNLDGYVTSGGQPVATMQTVPMIDCEKSSNFICENVRFIGRVNNGTVTGRGKTRYAVSGYTTGGGVSTSLTFKYCFFDGMETAAAFTPGNGNIDNLTVMGCRGRTFGTETAAAPDLNRNCFMSMSLCNATLINNYHVGFGTFPTQLNLGLFIVSSVGGGNSDVDVVVTGNSGGPSSGVTEAKSVYFGGTGTGSANSTGLKATISGNSWGTNAQNPWFITVGDGSSLINGSTGDFVGSGAIDLIISGGLTYSATVIVNGGTYIITNASANNYNFIGNSELTLPIFDMQLTGAAGTDELTQKAFVCGNTLKNITFTASTEFTSIRPGGTTSTFVDVEGCSFTNCTLSVNDHSGLENVRVMNCDFNQDNTIRDSLSIFLPRTDYILMEGCTFTGAGYVGHIGEDSGISYSTAGTFATGQVVIKDCVMDKTGFTINDAPTTTSPYAYLTINGNDADLSVRLENCQILASNTLASAPSVVDAGLVGTFRRFVFINAKDIFVDGCLLHGPSQTYTNVSSFPMPIMHITPTKTARITNSMFRRGGMSLKVGGTVTSMDGANADGLFIEGCSFDYPDSDDVQCMSLVDIEFEPTTFASPQISISNNRFYMAAAGADLFPEHTIITTDYNAHGTLQIYAKNFIVNLDNNSISGFIPSAVPAGKSQQAGLVVNTFNGSSVDSGTLTPINISDNTISVVNAYSSGVATEVCAAGWLKGTNIKTDDNQFRMHNNAVLSSNQIVCLYVNNLQNVSGNNPEKALITNNIFSRRRNTGIATSLLGGYIQINSTSYDGIIHGNVFSDDTIDGSSETVISDGTSNWTHFNNVNEIQSISIKGSVGQIGMSSTGGSSVAVVVGGQSTGVLFGAVESAIYLTQSGTTNQLALAHRDAGTALDFRWVIPFRGLLPDGVEVISVTVAADVTLNSSAGQSVLNVVSASGTDSNSSASPLTTAGHTHTLATSAQGGSGSTLMTNAPHKNFTSTASYIEVFGDGFDFGSDADYQVGVMTIKYRW